MANTLNILHLEDDPNDAELIYEALRSEGIRSDVLRVSTREDFLSALERGAADLIISDFALPQFDGLSALALARNLLPDTPFILVSGTMGEDAAVESLRNGATDYVLKTRLSRLVPAVMRAVEECRERRSRRLVERTLERERNFLRALLDSLEAGVVACGRDGELTLLNRATRALYGLPDDAEPTVDGVNQVRMMAADGKTPLEPAATPLARALRGETLRHTELTLQRPDGVSHVVVASGQPIVDEVGTRLGAVVAMHDVTAQKLLEHQLRHAQRMEAMGRLAAGVAHDFNNLLTVINGYCHLARLHAGNTDPMTNDLDEIAKAGQRAGDLTRQLLAFSRQQVLEPQVLDLNRVVSEMEKMLRRVIGADVELVVRTGGDVARIHADVGQMEQVLLNLIVNSRDAMAEGGLITVETANIDVASGGANHLVGAKGAEPMRGPLSRSPEVPAGSYVTLTVTDTGCGMDAETASKVFEPFFTTKGVGQGTGLGLSTVHGIISQSGGFIAVHTEVGLGTRFRIYLPRAVAEEVMDRQAATLAVPSPGIETILVVDDDLVLLRLVTQILSMKGYTVIKAESGQQALVRLNDTSQRIDALVTDVVMPGLSGREVAERALQLRPDLPIVFMSGYLAEHTDRLGTLLSNRIGFIQKPFTPEVILARLREVLDGDASQAA